MAHNSLEQEVARLLLSLGITIAVAESCTGGLICHRLTNVSGSSDYFERGVVAYSNRAKRELLGIPEQVIEEHGAVSEACVLATQPPPGAIKDGPQTALTVWHISLFCFKQVDALFDLRCDLIY